MGRNKALNYTDFGSSAGTGQPNSRGPGSNRGNGNNVFNRVGNNSNSFQALSDNAGAPGRIAFGGKVKSNQQPAGSGQSPQQSHTAQQGFTQNRSQQGGTRNNAQGTSRSQQAGSYSVQGILVDGIREHMNRKWPLTCYAAATEKVAELCSAPNEVNGDVSFEEVRWADYQETNKQACIARFNTACQAKSAQFQALQQSRKPPSQGGAAIPEPQSPYTDTPSAVQHMPNAFAAPQPSQNPFGQAAHPFGNSQAAFGQASKKFGAGATPAPPGQQQISQPGRIQFGQKAKSQATNPPRVPFQSSSQLTGDPFGRQRPAQAMQPPQQTGMPMQNPFGQPQQQQFLGTPAPFAMSGGQQNAHDQPGFGNAAAAGFQTPAVQRPAFGGGVAASLQTPAAGNVPAAPQQPAALTGADTGVQQESTSSSNVWTADEFEIGKIPEEPPPEVYCQA